MSIVKLKLILLAGIFEGSVSADDSLHSGANHKIHLSESLVVMLVCFFPNFRKDIISNSLEQSRCISGQVRVHSYSFGFGILCNSNG